MEEATGMEVGVSLEGKPAAAPWGLLYYGAVPALLVLGALYRAAERCWLGPRRVAGALQAQGLRGTASRFPAGDLPENARRSKEARAKPMPPCHDIVPRDILSNKFGHFEKFTLKSLGKLIALGLASYEGEKWARHRRILNPAFRLEKLKRMLPAFSTCCSEMIDRWDSKLADSDGPFELDIWQEFQNLTGDVISRTAFGSSFMEGRRIFQLQEEQADRIIKAVQYIYIPGYLYFPTENNRRMKENSREIEGLLRGIIEKRSRAVENGELSGDDLLGLMLKSNTDSGEPSNLRMSTEDVIEECKLFYFAGMETTSVLLTWTLVVLSMHPEWQHRAREEVTMILYEVLRLYPPAVTLSRRTFKEVQIGGITYPAGVGLELPIILIHHSTDVWGKDGHEFKPERFAEGISKATKTNQQAFFPFGWGPRICIGQNFAMLEAKMALCVILQNFEFQLSPMYTHAPYASVTLHPQHAMVLGAWLMSPASVPWSLLAYGVLGLVLLWQAGRLLHSLWWRPRRLELALRAQGLRGTRYRFLTGDLGEHGRLNREAWARPLPLRCHDIAPRVAPFLHNAVREHGSACFTWFGPTPKVTITDPDLAKDVLSNKFGHFEKPKFPTLTKLFSDSLANHEGEKWVKHRRILNPAFHLEKLKLMLPAFSACCEELVSKWMESLGSDGSYEVDVWPEMQILTGDVISRTAFGSSYLEGRRIFQLQAEQTERLLKCMQKIVIPGYMSLPTKNNRKMHQIKKETDSILRGLVDKRMQAMKEGECTKDDLLGLLLESNMRHTEEDGQSNHGLTIEEVIEECKLFYFAGMETTSVLLTWTILLLSMHPEWQDRAREEILGLFGKNKPGYEGLSRLKIVTMILYEVLRLYPPAVTFTRKTYKQMEIGGVIYPASVIVELPVLLIHHDPNIWGSDAHEFKPDRFAEGISKASKNPGAFLPFGWGPRICIGQNFALLEAKMALCMILQCFKLELMPSYTHAPYSMVTLRPMHAMVLGAGLRSPASVPWSLLAYGVLGLVLLWQAGRLLHSLWWRSRRLELALRAQGLRGTRYRFLTGDLGEHGRLNREVWARPLPLRCHDIAPRVAPFLHSSVREHGKACFSWFGPIPKVRDVLSNKLGHFEKPKLPALTKLLADGLTSHDGEKWVKHRRIMNPAFHLEKLKLMLPAFSTCCEELVGKWMDSLGPDGSCELDVWPEMQSLTGDVISRTAFGSSYSEGRRIFQLQTEQAELFIGAIQKIVIPGYMYLPTKKNRRMRRINSEVESILRGIIGKRMQAIAEGESTNDDLLGLLLESNMRHADENGRSSPGMTTEDVIEECKLFYFAGMETTSVLLTWTMVVLSMHPEWQDRAREEVFGLFGRDKPEYEGLSRLKTVTMVLYEVLRLYPPAIVFSRKTYKEMEIGGVVYPSGVILELPVLFIHHDREIWGSDVNEFRPERFAEGISRASNDRGAFLPFGWGPRVCIGQNFALLEAKMALCMILQRFEFELAASYTHAPHTVMTLHPMHGAQMKLRMI
uniref:Cytochrome P450 n=1 Tax=Oryza meridionalis TaxID=40149 RepID=A0A0E0C4Y4_9ORYZ